MDAIGEAMKGLKPRPAVDRIVTVCLTGKACGRAFRFRLATPDGGILICE